MIVYALAAFVVAILLGLTLVLLAQRRQRSSLPLAAGHALLAALGLGLLLWHIIATPGPAPKSYNLAAFLFVMALFGGLVLLALRLGKREFRTPAPLFVVIMHGVMGVGALLLLVSGYLHG